MQASGLWLYLKINYGTSFSCEFYKCLRAPFLQKKRCSFFPEDCLWLCTYYSRRLLMYLLVCYFLLGKWKMMHTSFETFRKKSYIYADLVSFTRLSFTAPCFLWIKVELSPSKKVCFICFNESLLKILKTCFSLHLESSFRFENI